jgi:hypothetical protein
VCLLLQDLVITKLFVCVCLLLCRGPGFSVLNMALQDTIFPIFKGDDLISPPLARGERAGRESAGARRWAQVGRLRRARASWKGSFALRQRARSAEFPGVGCTAARPSTLPGAGTGGGRRVEAGPRRAARRARVVSNV